MRVTSNTFPQDLLRQINQLTQRQNRLQSQAATGQRVQSPEDDPAAMRRVLDLQAESKTIQQYQRNISLHRETAAASYDAVNGLKKISDRTGEIATLADSLKSPQQLAIMGREVTELIKQAVQLSNTKHRGDHLFGGTRTDQPPFVMSTNDKGQVTGVQYQGNTDLPESEIASGVTVTTRVAGVNTTGSGPRGLITDTDSGADFLNHLVSLQDHLLAGDAQSVMDTDRQRLAKDEENLIFHLGNNGALQARLETTEAVLSQRDFSLEKLVSEEADADLSQTLVNLQQTQYAYQAALQSGASLLNQSLLDYLR